MAFTWIKQEKLTIASRDEIELISSQIKLLVIAITVLLFPMDIIRQPTLATVTATPRSPDARTATIITNGIESTDAAITPNEELNITGTTGSPTTITLVEINSTDAATSDEELNVTDTTRSPAVTTNFKAMPFEINSTDELNITATTKSPTTIAKTIPEEINSTNVTTTDEFIISSTSEISDGVAESTTLADGARSEATSEPQSTTAIKQPDQPS